MSWVQLYHGAGGRKVVESSGAEGDVGQMISRDYHDRILFYHNPKAGEIECYVKVQRTAEEQYMAVYRDDGGRGWQTQIEDFRSSVKDLVERSKWRIVADGSSNQIVYDRLPELASGALGDGVGGELENWIEGTYGVSLDEYDLSFEGIARELRNEGALDIVTPSAGRAVDVLGYVRSALGEDWSVAISRSGRTEGIDAADVVIIPDESVSVVQLENSASDRIRDAIWGRIKEDAGGALGSVRAAVAGGHEDPDGAVASALNENGAPEKLGVYFTGENDGSGLPSLRGLKLGAGLAVVLGAAFLVVYYWPGVSSLFANLVQARFSVPAEDPALSVSVVSELWVWIVASLLVGGFVVLATAERRRLVRRLLSRDDGPSSVTGMGRVPNSPTSGEGTVEERTRAALGGLRKVRDLWDTDDEYHQRLQEVLRQSDGVGLQFVDAGERERDRRIGRLLNVLAGLVPVGLALAAVYLYGGRAVRILDAEYVTLVRVFVWAGILFLVVFVAEVVLRALSGTVPFAGGDDGRSTPEQKLDRLRENFERGSTTVYFRDPSAYVSLLDHRDDEIRTETARLLRDNLDEQQIPERVEDVLGPTGTALVDEPRGVDGAEEPERGVVSSDGSSQGGIAPDESKRDVESSDDPGRGDVAPNESTGMSMERSEDGSTVRRGPTDSGDGGGESTTATPETATEELAGALSHDENAALDTVTSRPDSASYPSYRFGPANTGYTPVAGRRGEGWSYPWPPEPFDHGVTAPVVGEDCVYVGGEDGHVHAIQLVDGRIDEIGAGGGRIPFPPVLDPEQAVLFVVSTTGDGSTLHRYGLDGTARGSVPLDAEVSCPPALDGSTVVVGDEDGSVYNIDAGAMRVRNRRSSWSGSGRHGERPHLAAAPVMDDEKRLAYFVSSDGKLYKLDWNGGIKPVGVDRRVKPFPPVWDEATQSLVIATEPEPIVRIGREDADDFPLPAPVSGPFSVADGTVYAALENDRVVAVDMQQGRAAGWEADGLEEWSVALEPWNGDRSVTVGGDTVYVAGEGVRAFDRVDGELLWHYEETNGGAKPVAVVDGTVVVTDGSNTVHVLDV
jgi:outer membrane protein assembly factor BamB